MIRFLFLVAFIFSLSASAYSQERLRIKLSVDEAGNATMTAGHTTQKIEESTTFFGLPVEGVSLPNTTILRGEGGKTQVNHKFELQGDGKGIFQGFDPRIDGTSKSLSISTTPNQLRVNLNHQMRLKAPFTVVADFGGLGDDCGITTTINWGNYHRLNATVFNSDFKQLKANRSLAATNAVWVDAQSENKPNMLLPARAFGLAEGTTRTFQIPISGKQQTDNCSISFLLSSQGNATHRLHALLVEGTVTPLFGIQFADLGGKVYVQQVSDDSFGSKAGIEKGDEVISINGTAIKTMQEAVDLLATVGFGETAKFEIRRGTSQKTVAVEAK